MMYITYDHKNGTDYAKLVTSHYINGKDKKSYINLGRVVDKDKGIYTNRKRGTFHYDLETDTYTEVQGNHDAAAGDITIGPNEILNFGDVWFLDQFIRNDGLLPAVEAILPDQVNTVLCLICFYVLNNLGLCHAEDWYEHSFASILYPGLDICSQRVSELLPSIGNENSLRRFFAQYSQYLKNVPGDSKKVIMDSTGLPNSIHFPLTAVNNHNGTISREIRLEFVVEQDTGMPVYMRYMCGSIPDVSTISATLLEMEQQNMDVKDMLIDAGYFSDENFQTLARDNIDFITRLKENLTLYKELFALHRSEIVTQENTFKYGGRAVFIKEVKTEIPLTPTEEETKEKKHPKKSVYVYICLDIGRAALENLRMLETMDRKKLSETQIYEDYQTHGSFALLSSKQLNREEVLPLYYVRQQVEQTFDLVKNNTNCQPLRIHSEKALRGHLLLTFIATAIVKRIQHVMEFEQPKREKKFNPETLLLNLGYQHCKVYENTIVVQEADSKANQGYRVFGIKSPLSFPRN